MNVKLENLEKIDDVLTLLHKLLEKQSQHKRWLTVAELSTYIGYSKDRIHSLTKDEFLEGQHYYKK
jgi:arsenate reductase-like glutaredoxin family protein